MLFVRTDTDSVHVYIISEFVVVTQHFFIIYKALKGHSHWEWKIVMFLSRSYDESCSHWEWKIVMFLISRFYREVTMKVA